MISGAGASIKEYYGVNYYVGGVMMALLVFAAFAFGRKRLIDAVGLLGPLIIGVTIYVAICVVSRNGEFQSSDASSARGFGDAAARALLVDERHPLRSV